MKTWVMSQNFIAMNGDITEKSWSTQGF